MGSIDPADQQAMGPINARIAVAAAPPAAAAGEGAGASMPSVDPLLARLQELMRASLGAEGEAATQSPNTMRNLSAMHRLASLQGLITPPAVSSQMQSAAPAPAEMAPVTPPRAEMVPVTPSRTNRVPATPSRADRVPSMPLQTERVQATGGPVGRRLDLSGIVGWTASLQARA